MVDKGSTELLLIRSRRCLVKQVEDQSKTGKIKYFFVQLVVNIWNSLPWEIAEALYRQIEKRVG